LVVCFAEEPFNHRGELTLEGLGWPTDMLADLRNNCVYIGDRYGSEKTLQQGYPGIFVLPESGNYSRHALDVQPAGLSFFTLDHDRLLLVVCEHDKKSRSLRFFRSEGSSEAVKLTEERRIDLQIDYYLLQAVALNSERFLISRRRERQRIDCIVVADYGGNEVSQCGLVFSFNNILFMLTCAGAVM